MAEKRQYVNLDQFTTEELEEMLSAEIEATENGDDDFVLHILEVIEQRESENPTGRLCDVDKAWADFQKYYQNAEGIGQSLYPSDPFESIAAQGSSKRRPIRRMLRKLPVSAAIVAATLSIIVVAQAAGFDICGVIAKWTDETFQFEYVNRKQEAPEENSMMMKEALIECAISASLAPTWFPDGFKMDKPEVAHTDYSDIVFCSFEKGQGNGYVIKYQNIHSTQNFDKDNFEKDSGDVEQYSNGVQTFYIMSNIDTLTATWSNGHICISIIGKISNEEVKKIIDSIGVN